MLLGSADLMPRNLDHRVEVIFPVLAPDLVDRLREMLALSLADDVEAWELHPDGAWTRVPTVTGVSVQEALRVDAIQRASRREDTRSRVAQ
jgi:polyphosphate kinase